MKENLNPMKISINLTTEQLQAILDGAPSGATHVDLDLDETGLIFYKDEPNQRLSIWIRKAWLPSFRSAVCESKLIKLSDIRAEISSREQLVDETVNDELAEKSVIETTHTKCALLRDSSLEKLQWLINENLANGWNLVGAVVSAGIHNDTFVATMMKVAGDE